MLSTRARASLGSAAFAGTRVGPRCVRLLGCAELWCALRLGVCPQIGTSYRAKDGTPINSMPANLEVLEEVQVGVCPLLLLCSAVGVCGKGSCAVCRRHTAHGPTCDCAPLFTVGAPLLLCAHTITSLMAAAQPACLAHTRAQVGYETVPGWLCDISRVRRWEDLPQQARDYVQRIEDLTGIYCRWIGVGPGRDAIVLKPRMGKC